MILSRFTIKLPTNYYPLHPVQTRHTLHRKSREAMNPQLEPTRDKQHRSA